MRNFLPFLLLQILLFSVVWAQTDFSKDRARAYQDKGTLKLAIENYGRFGGMVGPEGEWWGYRYIGNFSLVLGVPGKDEQGKPYPWALGPKQIYDVKRDSFYTIGSDTTYWGPTVSESWFDRTPALDRTDWEAVANSSENLFNPEATAGKYYGRYGWYTNSEDTKPLIATSTIPNTWPLIDSVRTWPGHWAIDPTSQEEIKGKFVSDQDIYFRIDDRLATRDVDPVQGYPTNIMVEVTSYSYSDSSARDMIFFNLILHNQSEFDYKNVYVGIYFDADVYHRQANGSYLGRTNDDDMMSYDLENKMAYIYDIDKNEQNQYVANNQLAYCALKFLDTPTSSKALDLDGDGITDVYPGDKLGLTSWHWFDWYHRPGARDENPYEGPWSGDGETAIAANKEEIQYKIMAGDTSNLSIYDSTYYFHHAYDINGKPRLNPFFDSDEALLKDYPQGLDCIFIMATGPFDLNSGDSVPFSFCLIMAKNPDQLKLRAETAQLMFENNYQLIPTAVRNLSGSNTVKDFRLFNNFPNPFNPSTTIAYYLPVSSDVEIAIYNLLGQKVRMLTSENQTAGHHSIKWDGLDEHGNAVASGIYLYKLEAKTNSKRIVKTKKMCLIR